ncbi:toll/interleukin-1 receptor domain-containing protein [Candidatus Poribacteria bacterium]|nr:toll/interleukin-1 receptor domain-containing protein [Candidatus Poribacteria bacterium]
MDQYNGQIYEIQDVADHARVTMTLGGIGKAALNQAQSALYNEIGRAKVQEWGAKMSRGEWNWDLLGQALKYYIDSIKYAPEYQNPWTDLAYVCHLIGEMQRARDCLQKSYELASPGPYHPGRHYKYVKSALDGNSTLSGSRLNRSPMPDWFRQKSQRLLDTISLTPQPPGAIGIFLSYAHEDEELRNKLEKHLTILKQQGVITGWRERKIGTGREWADAIDEHLDMARVILMLISPDFIASGYTYGVEMKRAMQRYEAGEAHLIPIILRPVYWKDRSLGKLQALPTDAKPVTNWANLDDAFANVAKGLMAVVAKSAEDTDLSLFLRELLTASPLSEIPTVLAASEKTLSFLLGQQEKTGGEGGLQSTFDRLNEAVSPLNRYSQEVLPALQTMPLSETIANLEEAARFVSLKGAEPYRTILLPVLANWRQFLYLEVRRLEDEARSEFATLEEVKIMLEIHNRGPVSASNLRVKLIGEGFVEVKPDIHTLRSLAVNESRKLLFTARSSAKRFITEFVITYDNLLAKANKQWYTVSVAVCAGAHVWNYLRNPYLPGNPDPALKEVERLFVGREDVLRFIEENLVGAVTERIVVLYGHRRTGKTWTLLRLCERLPAAYLPVYINVQEFTGVSGVPAVLQIFADEVLRTIEERCKLDQAALLAIRVPTFEQYHENYPYHFKRKN